METGRPTAEQQIAAFEERFKAGEYLDQDWEPIFQQWLQEWIGPEVNIKKLRGMFYGLMRQMNAQAGLEQS